MIPFDTEQYILCAINLCGEVTLSLLSVRA